MQVKNYLLIIIPFIIDLFISIKLNLNGLYSGEALYTSAIFFFLTYGLFINKKVFLLLFLLPLIRYLTLPYSINLGVLYSIIICLVFSFSHFVKSKSTITILKVFLLMPIILTGINKLISKSGFSIINAIGEPAIRYEHADFLFDFFKINPQLTMILSIIVIISQICLLPIAIKDYLPKKVYLKKLFKLVKFFNYMTLMTLLLTCNFGLFPLWAIIGLILVDKIAINNKYSFDLPIFIYSLLLITINIGCLTPYKSNLLNLKRVFRYIPFPINQWKMYTEIDLHPRVPYVRKVHVDFPCPKVRNFTGQGNQLPYFKKRIHMKIADKVNGKYVIYSDYIKEFYATNSEDVKACFYMYPRKFAFKELKHGDFKF